MPPCPEVKQGWAYGVMDAGRVWALVAVIKKWSKKIWIQPSEAELRRPNDEPFI